MEKKEILEVIEILREEQEHLEDRIIGLKLQLKNMKHKSPKYQLTTKNIFGYESRIYEVFKLISKFERRIK